MQNCRYKWFVPLILNAVNLTEQATSSKNGKLQKCILFSEDARENVTSADCCVVSLEGKETAKREMHYRDITATHEGLSK
jgi:hypothetical protein